MIARPPRGHDPEEQADWNEEVERVVNKLSSGPTYGTITNVTTDRSFDADATTTAELADVLGTLIADLRTTGVIQ
jgi:hypothetical protein